MQEKKLKQSRMLHLYLGTINKTTKFNFSEFSKRLKVVIKMITLCILKINSSISKLLYPFRLTIEMLEFCKCDRNVHNVDLEKVTK